MHKCGMWKPDTDNQTLLQEVPPVEGQQKKIQYPEQCKMLLGRDFEVEKIMKFLNKINIKHCG